MMSHLLKQLPARASFLVKSGVLVAAMLLLCFSGFSYAETTVNIGNGAFITITGKKIYSTDVASSESTLLATIPPSIGGINTDYPDEFNSLAINRSAGFLYFVSPLADTTNTAVFAYDIVNDTFVLVDADVTARGVQLLGINRGLASGGASFENSQQRLYLGLENGSTKARVYSIPVDATGYFSGPAAFEWSWEATTSDFDFGDFVVIENGAGATKLYISMVNLAIGNSFFRIGLGTLQSQGDEVWEVSWKSIPGFAQIGSDHLDNMYLVYDEPPLENQFQRIDIDGNVSGSAVAMTSDGTTPITDAPSSDAGGGVTYDASIGNYIWVDANDDGIQNGGESPIEGVTVDIYYDANGNGLVDSPKDRLLGSDVTDVNGLYKFNGLIPAGYIIKITDTAGKLEAGGHYTTTGGNTQTADIALSREFIDTVDFGYYQPLPLADLVTVKSVSDANPSEGDVITYTITVNNNGPADATNVTLTDVLPSGVTLTGSSQTGGSVNTYVGGVWTIGDLANGAVATLSITADVDVGSSGLTIVNTTTAAGRSLANSNG